MRLRWTRRALRDLDALAAWIGRDSPIAAQRQARLVLAAVEHLPRFPDSGRPGRVAGTREIVVSQSPYIVAYRRVGDTIELLAVLHGRQRWPDTL
jgi:addiction module RelE/StbE family toxin